jgi:predicted nucleotidyltransferase
VIRIQKKREAGGAFAYALKLEPSARLTIPKMGIIIPNMSMIANALFSSTQQRVLRVLFGQADRSFYANEIIALAGSGTGAVQRELMRLEGAGLVTARRVGNQKHYQANRASPVFAELQSLVSKTIGAAEILRRYLASLFPAIDVAFIYGSVADGTDHAGSDVDLMVIGTINSTAQLLDVLAPAQAELGRTINPTLYAPDEFSRRVRENRSFILRVLAKPKLFVKGTEDDLDRIGKLIENRQAQA